MADNDEMPDADQSKAPTAAAAASGPAAAPRIRIANQYVKDLSFENPGARTIAQPSRGRPQPQIEVQINVETSRLNPEDMFEVSLKLVAGAKRGEESVFLCDLEYAGLFQLTNIPSENLQAALLIQCPHMLFPFARRIIADATRDGGYSPLMLEPIDFVALYRARMAAKTQKKAEMKGSAATAEK